MKPVRTISSYVLLAGVMGLSIVGGVVIYQIYSASVKNQASATQIEAIKPLDGVINQTVIDGLSNRTTYTDTQMDASLRAVPVVEPTPSTTTTSETQTAPIVTESPATASAETTTTP